MKTNIVYFPVVQNKSVINTPRTPFVILYNNQFIYFKNWVDPLDNTLKTKMTWKEMKDLHYYDFVPILSFLRCYEFNHILKKYDNRDLNYHKMNINFSEDLMKKIYTLYKYHKLFPFKQLDTLEIENELSTLLGKNVFNLENLLFFPAISMSLNDNISNVYNVKDLIFKMISLPIFIESLDFCKSIVFREKQQIENEYFLGISNYKIVWATPLDSNYIIDENILYKIKNEMKIKQCIIKICNGDIIQIYSDLVELPKNVDPMHPFYSHLHDKNSQINVYY
jgi:hypothetical protein